MFYSTYYPFKSEADEKEYWQYYKGTAAQLWPVPFENILVPTDFGSTFVRASGPKNAPPLVLLHGITATSMMWAPNVGAWSQDYRVYAVDIINDYGLSRNTKCIWRKQQLLQWLDQVCDGLGIHDKINLVGMSYGGWLAALYAASIYGKRLHKLVLLAPGSPVLNMNWEFLKRSLGSTLFGGKAAEYLFTWLFADGVKHSERCVITMEDFGYFLYMGMQHFQRRFFIYPGPLAASAWKNVQVPVLFLVGEHEKLYDPEKAIRKIKRLVPTVSTQLIPEAGHDLTMVQAPLVNQAVLDFLR
jgi:pimeloyl-ACP methyl ester carboxylesterase